MTKRTLILVVTLALLSVPVASAKELSLTYLGGLVGAGSPSNSNAGLTYGLTFGRRMTPDFGTGVYVTRLKSDVTTLGLVTSSATLTAYGIEGNYYFTGDMDGMVVGVKLGLLSRSIDIGNVSYSATPLSIGPKIAFDHKMANSLSLGFEANVLFQSSNNGQDAYSLVNLLGAVKLWF